MNQTDPARWLMRLRPRVIVAVLVPVTIALCIWGCISASRRSVAPTQVSAVAPKAASNGALLKAESVAAADIPLIDVATIRWVLPPPLEQERALLAGDSAFAGPEQLSFAARPPDHLLDSVPNEQWNADPANEAVRSTPRTIQDVHSPVQFITDFECGTPLSIREISPTHYVAELISPGYLRGWFIFRLHGVAGKTIRIDLGGDLVMTDKKWKPLNPLYTYASDLGDPATYSCSDADSKGALSAAWNGAELPSTNGQKWHYIVDCWMPNDKTFSLVQHFESNDACVGMRIPHPPGYNEHFFRQLSSNPYVTVVNVGKTAGGRPLLMAQIGAGHDQAAKRKPCILLYAGEHADEQDSMWVAQGAIEYLASDQPEAARLRDELTMLVIPVLDPATSSIGQHSGMLTTFLTYQSTRESNAYANWFQQWVRAGHRLDAVFDLANVQAAESSDIHCAIIEGKGTRGQISFAYHQMLLDGFAAGGYQVDRKPTLHGWSPDRLGGWLSRRYGPITLTYQFNCQATKHHLNLIQLKNIGASLTRSTGLFLSTANGEALLADVDARRKEWADSWAKFGAGVADPNALQSELDVSRAAHLRSDPNDAKGELWIN